MVVKVFEYGLLQPTLNGDRVREQMKLAHDYQNKLVEIERERRVAYRAVIGEDTEVASQETKLAEIRSEIATLVETISAARKASRSRVTLTTENAKVKALKSEAKRVIAVIKSAKAIAKNDPVRIARVAAVDEDAHRKTLEARASFTARGLYWGTYLLAEAAAQAAQKSKTDPHFQRWMGDGAVAVQIQSTSPLETLFGDDTRLRVAPLPADAWTHPKRGERRRKQQTVLSLRIGSNGRAPVWATWPMIMHRPLPDGAKVTWAKVLMEKRSPHPSQKGKAPWSRWVVQITADVPGAPLPSLPVHPKIVGVDLGWRKRPDGMRVAYLVDTDGRSEEFVTRNDAVMDRLDKASSIRGFRDTGIDAMRVAVKEALSEAMLPDDVREQIKSIALWKSAGRFVVLLDALRQIEAPDEATRTAIQVINAWRIRDRHLGHYEDGVRRGGFGHRRETYRVFAAALANKYDVIVLEDFDLRDTAQKEDVEEPVRGTKTHREQQRRTAPAELRQVIENAAKREGVYVLRVSAVNSTRTCIVCQCICAGDMAEAIEYRCEHCGEVWDQDENAARNLIARGQVVIESPDLFAACNTAPLPRKARFSKRHKSNNDSSNREEDEVLAK